VNVKRKVTKTEGLLLALTVVFLSAASVRAVRLSARTEDCTIMTQRAAEEGAAYELPPPLDLNTADTEALEQLPGIGPVLAERIVAWRTEHGGFRTVEELLEVKGIGEAVLAELRGLVAVNGPPQGADVEKEDHP